MVSTVAGLGRASHPGTP